MKAIDCGIPDARSSDDYPGIEIKSNEFTKDVPDRRCASPVVHKDE